MRIHSSSLYFPPAGLKQQHAQTGNNASRDTRAEQSSTTGNSQTQSANAKRPVQQVTETAFATLNINASTDKQAIDKRTLDALNTYQHTFSQSMRDQSNVLGIDVYA